MPSGQIMPYKIIDYDTGAGTDNVSVFGILLPKSGGAVAGGTAADPLRVDPTGSTTQPVSVVSLPLPSGAATSAKQPALGSAGTAATDVITVQGIASGVAQSVTDTRLPAALGQQTKSGSLPVTIASDQDVLPVSVAEKTLVFTTGTISSSGDNTILAAPGSLQNKILFLQIQNESSTATTVIVKFGTTAKARVLCQNQGDGMQFTAPPGRNWGAGTTTLIALNLSGANSVGYTLVTANEA